MTQIIKFTDTIGIPEEYAPKPASKIIPEWYKNLDSYVGHGKRPSGRGETTATAKRCMPIFDAICSGYIISTYADVYVSQKINEDGVQFPFYEWPTLEPISFHGKAQLPEHPYDTGHKIEYPKWGNAWAIKTPPGYSCLFIPPAHRETPIMVLPGIVDTDNYSAPVNFPFVLKDPNMDGLIPAGTPIVQVIPFKRDDWEMSFGTNKDYEEQVKITLKLKTMFFDSYKKQFRQGKNFR